MRYGINAVIDESVAQLLFAVTAIALLDSVLLHGPSMQFTQRRRGRDADGK